MKTKFPVLPRNKALARGIMEHLRRAFPDLPDQLLADIAVDLADIYVLGQKHVVHLSLLLKLKLPKEKVRLRKLLTEMETNLLHENQWHLRSLRTRLPKLLDELHKPRGQSRRARALAREQRAVEKAKSLIRVAEEHFPGRSRKRR